MLVFPPPKFRRRPRGMGRLTIGLVAATYQAASSVTLKFNQPIDLTAIAINSAQVTDGPGGHIYIGVAATAVDPFTVRITLQQVTTVTGAGVKLDFEAPTGIKTIGRGGQEWAGVSGLVLPYP